MTATSDEGSQFAPDTMFEPAIGVNQLEVGEDTVLFDVLHNRCVRLNSTGTQIWRRLMERPTYSDLVTYLTSIFQVDEQQAGKALEPYLADLLARGLIGTSHEVHVETEQRIPQ